jgi:hypothetical protein
MSRDLDIELEDRLLGRLRELDRIDVPAYSALRNRAVRHRSSVPSLAVVAAAIVLVVFGAVLGNSLLERRASDEPAWTVGSAGPPGRTIASPATASAWDVVYAVSRQSGAAWTTLVYRLDRAAPNPVLLAAVPESSAPPAVFASPRGAIYVFASERSYLFRLPARFQGPNLPLYASGSEGPRIAAVSMHFVGERAFASTATEIIEFTDSADLARFPSIRAVANLGGEILSELVDRRLLVGSLAASREMSIYALALDGRSERIAVVPDAIGPIAAPAGSTVILSRYLRPTVEDRTGISTIVNLDLVTLKETFSQHVGTPNNFSFAATHTAPGYVFTDPKAFFSVGDFAGSVVFGARGSAGSNWGREALTRGALPILDPKRSWSPDDAYVAFVTGAEYAGPGSYEITPAVAGAHGLALYTKDKRRIREIAPLPGARITVAGWVGR